MPLDKAEFFHQGDDLFPLLRGSAKGNHHLDIGQAHVASRLPERAALELKSGFVLLVIVTRRASPADHGVVFRGFVKEPAQQVLILVRFEIGKPHDDVVGVKAGRDSGNPFSELINKKLGFVIVDRCNLVDLVNHAGNPLIRLCLLLQFFISDERHGMNSNVGIDDELLSRKTDSVIRDHCLRKGLLRDSHIHHDFCSGLRHFVQIDGLHLKLQQAVVNQTRFSFTA